MIYSVEMLSFKLKKFQNSIFEQDYFNKFRWFFDRIYDTTSIMLPINDPETDLFISDLAFPVTTENQELINIILSDFPCEVLFFLYGRDQCLTNYLSDLSPSDTLTFTATNDKELFIELYLKIWKNWAKTFNLNCSIDITKHEQLSSD